MSKASEKAIRAKLEALCAHLRTSTGPLNAASLSRSYGLPQPEVEKLIRSVRHA